MREITDSELFEFDKLYERILRNIPLTPEEQKRYQDLMCMFEEFNCDGFKKGDKTICKY